LANRKARFLAPSLQSLSLASPRRVEALLPALMEHQYL